jgi:carboxypeptidase C (cathepsin A)
MKKLCTLLFSLALTLGFSQNRNINPDTLVRTNHSVVIKGKTVPYQATAGTQPVWGEDGKPTATLFYTYYKRSDVKDTKNRPLIFSFNGGPGSSSVWMHMAYTGPKILNIDDEGYPMQPYGYSDNPHSILDVADIVFIDPVDTGYSIRLEDEEGKLADKKEFYGINADVKYLAAWVNTFVSRNNRWLSPKYLIGESYGGTRVMGLSYELQSQFKMYLNGVILVSPADYKMYNTGNAIGTIVNIPYFTAAAWYHKMLPPALQNKDLEEILPEAETFALDEALPALSRGGYIDADLKDKIAERMAYYTGLSKKAVLSQNLDVTTSFFWKELLRDKSGHIIGRLDSRYLGLDKKDAGDSPDYSPELTSWYHSFTPPINHYLRNELKFVTDVPYEVLGDVSPWDRTNDNVRENMRKAMAQNPYLQVLVQSGYYDGATTYFQAKQTMWFVDPSGKLKDRFTFKGYRSGHMMYLRSEDLKAANDDLREFIGKSYKEGQVAKY